MRRSRGQPESIGPGLTLADEPPDHVGTARDAASFGTVVVIAGLCESTDGEGAASAAWAAGTLRPSRRIDVPDFLPN